MQVPVLALAKAIVLVGIAFAIAALLVVAPTVTRAQANGLIMAGHPTSWARLF